VIIPDLRKFNFAVVPTAPNGFLTEMGKIATDYAKVLLEKIDYGAF